jgi:hypothetical protein
MRRILAATLFLIAVSASAMAQGNPAIDTNSMKTIAHLKDFQVIELRRYTIKKGEREHFAQYFDTYFPEVLEQLGTIIFGEFFERKNPSAFTWIRGFHSMDDRAIANAVFYYGPVWKEHKSTMNNLLIDSDNVLLLRPLTPERGLIILPAVDPITEVNDARGIAVAQIFAVQANSVEEFAKEAEATFASYPQLPIRTDGPYLVWLGILKDNQMLKNEFTPLAERSLPALSATGLIRGTPELVVLDPTHRSRLRWFPRNSAYEPPLVGAAR